MIRTLNNERLAMNILPELPATRESTRLVLAIRSAAIASILALCSGTGSANSGLVIYPSKGQSTQQQAADENECRAWARQETGFDPARAPKPQASNSSGGEIVGGAAKGAVLGIVGGAIAGDAGKGAAVGAGVGATAGLMRKNRNRRADNQAQQQSVDDYNRQLDGYNRAFVSCMQGHGYAVN